ncbi:MAG: hypothetical protein A4E62_02735 [Syntrophorhabdus sp. PtaU1.Bin002]|nr:MAG: hypothetical protein A4E62_02735 [Syntrophorhabdus sp. PtaU1.Bin002]
MPKEKEVLFSYLLPDFNVRPIEGPYRQCPVQGEFHVSRSGSFISRCRNLLREFGCRHNTLSKTHIIVGDKNHAQFVTRERVGVNKATHIMNQFNDQLAKEISRGCLPGEEHSPRDQPLVRPPLPDPVIQSNNMHNIKKLPLVFMESLCLTVKEVVGRQRQPVCVVEILRQRYFVGFLDTAELTAELLILGKGFQFPQLFEVPLPAFADGFGYQSREKRICLKEPAPGCNTVRHVLKLLGHHSIKIFEHPFPKNSGVELRDTIDGMAADYCKTRHIHGPFPPSGDKTHLLFSGRLTGEMLRHLHQKTPVNLLDDLEVPREDIRKKPLGPRFKGLRQYRMVRVSEGPRSNSPSIVPHHPLFVHKNSHQLGDGDRRMGIVKLDRNLLRKLIVAPVRLLVSSDDIHKSGADEEILLFEPQLLACCILVTRVEHLRDIFTAVAVLYCLYIVTAVEELKVKFPHRLGSPQTERVHRIVLEPRDRVVVGHSHNFIATHPFGAVLTGPPGLVVDPAVKPNEIEKFRSREFPWITIPQPVVRGLYLKPVFDSLLENTIFVANAIAIARVLKGCQGIKKTSCKPSETSITKSRIPLKFRCILAGDAKNMHSPSIFVGKTKVENIVLQKPPKEKLKRQIVDPFCIDVIVTLLGPDPSLRNKFPYRKGKGLKLIPRRSGIHVFCKIIGETIGKGMANRVNISFHTNSPLS